MRSRFRLPRLLAVLAATSTALLGFAVAPSLAAAAPAGLAAPTEQAQLAATAHSLPPTGSQHPGDRNPAPAQQRVAPAQLPPRIPATAPVHHPAVGTATATSASCTPGDFSSRTGAALVAFVEAATPDCVNTLFGVTGSAAGGVFKESQMLTVANAFQGSAAGYTGDDSTGIWQLVLFLRAGYYVQYYDSTDVGSYDATLTNAVAAGIDAFVGSAHFADVTDANGQVAGEVVVLSDSADLQARYLKTYQQVLNGYSSATYNSSWYMVNFVNDVFTPLYRGHQNADFVTAVTNDPSIITTLDTFALNHRDLLGTGNSFLDSNAGLETARFVEHTALQSTVRPLIKGLLGASAITGPTAPLWVGVANLASYYDQANCAYYDVCNLVQRLTAAALPISRSCDAAHTILAQDLSATDLNAVCASLQNQDPYVHTLVKDNGPIPGQYESTLQLVVFASSTDYQTYAGPIYGVSTNNGGITLIGDPTDATNLPRSIMYRDAGDDGFTARVWNLNHEYTHALDGRFDLKGNFSQQIAVPDVWWIEGVAEYVSYSYRGVTDTQALAEAAKHTYALSTLFQNTYDNSDTTRTYPWGYLAVRYMVEKHPDVIQSMLGHFRTGDYTGGYATYNSLGTSYDADFSSWLDSLAGGSGGGVPAAAFDAAVSGLTVQLTDRSTESGTGSITGWSWNFGDGTGSTQQSPAKTYTAAGSYTVSLTVTDSGGRTASTSRTVTVGAGGAPVPCTAADTRAMGPNCYRSGQAETVQNLDYFYLWLPAGTTTLTVTSTGGTGTAYLYYNANSWATPSAYTSASTHSGTAQSLTVTNTAAGYRYFSLYAQTAFSGVTVTTQY
ncbi:collagenase [Kitasatospora sp. NPDC058965]|uniref:collagenase n=1 Tax=Kitasatospora sp. NPDC058965 TaxID=3346682 RepID=UPI0036AC1E48